MWTLFILLNLGLLHGAVSTTPPSPINVVFYSVNLRNLVQWEPGNGTPVETLFTVQYAIYGQSVTGIDGKPTLWRVVRHCTNIVRTWCDLSNETWDQEEGYYARVRAVRRKASSKWALIERRFDPKSDTSFGPPLVSVEVEGNNAIITLKGPERYQPSNHTPVIPMAMLYPQMTYSLSIMNYRRNQTRHFPVVSNPYKYQLMEHSTEYCFSAKARLVPMPIKCQSSSWHCITTPEDPVPGQLKRMVLCIVVPCLCICVLVVVGYFLHNYLMGKGQKRPHMLNQLDFPPPATLTFPPEKLNLFLISVIEDKSPSGTTISVPACPKQHIAAPPPRYSRQRPETPTEPDDSAIEYGFVGVAPKISVGGEEEAKIRRHNRGEDGNNLKGNCQNCIAGASYKKKLLRVDDGHLAGVYSPQAKSYLSRKSTHTCTETHMQIHSQTHAQMEVSTLAQAQAWKSVLMSQIHGSLPSFQEATKGEADREKEDRECPGLFLNKNLQTNVIHVPLNLQTNEEIGNGKMDGTVEEGSESEKVSLISAYASQNINNMLNIHTDQSDFLPSDYGLLSVATVCGVEEDKDEEEQGTICINWDPETRKLVLPEMAMKFNIEEVLGVLMQGEEGEMEAMKSELNLENVFVRQGSEEEAEEMEMESAEKTEWEADDILTKWDLVISLDQ